jgi:hypothetical protein
MRQAPLFDSSRDRHFLWQWISWNSLALGCGFLIATVLSIKLTIRPEDTVSLFCFACEEFPINPLLIFLPGYLWAQVQILLLKSKLVISHPIGWIITCQLGLLFLGGLTWLIWIWFFVKLSDIQTPYNLTSLLSIILMGVVNGLVLGSVIGVSQLFLASLKREWIVWSILSWSSAIICGWLASGYTYRILLYSFKVEDEIMISIIRMGVLGAVFGFTGSIVSGIGILRCRRTQPS